MAKKKHLSFNSSSEAEESVESEEQVEVDEEDDEEEVESSEEEEAEPEPVREQQKKASSPAEVKKTKPKPANTRSEFVAAAATPTKSSQKRPAVENGGGEGSVSMKAKKKKEAEVLETDGTVEKDAAAATGERQSFSRRFWSEGDEIVILEGIVDYMEKQGLLADIKANIDAFHKSIKPSLHVDTTNQKLLDKIRKMKAKYERKNVENRGRKSEDDVFRSLHEVKVYDLSKKIWGNNKEANNGGGGGGSGIDQRSTRAGMKESPKKNGEQNAGPSQSQMLVSDDLLNEKSFMKEGLTLIDIGTRSDLEQNWKKLKIDEAELYLRRIDLAGKQTKLVLDAYKKL